MLGSSFKTFRYQLMIATALAGGAALANPVSAWAQTPVAEQQKTADYNIPAQDLNGALRQFAEVSKLQLIYDAKIADGKRSAGVTGNMTAEAALSRILAGSGLGYAFSGSAVTISLAGQGGQAAAPGTQVFAPVRIQADDDTASSPVNGVNGSRDVTATEGTNSYTSGALDIVSKIPQSIKDTPQTVSVITAQQIEDENLNDLSTALEQAPGITVINSTGSGPQEANFYSRGFQITTLQIDGGAPLDMQTGFGFSPTIDLSEYDSLQIIRGADGLFGGYGDPSGVISLVRKKPLDHVQLTSDTQVGSWNLYRESLDLTGPLTADKNLKGRVVATYQDNDYFYKIAKDEEYLLYANLEYDFSPNTSVNIGASYAQNRQVPNTSGIPTYANGGAPNLPTSTCLCFGWNRDNLLTTEAFAQFNHKFNKDWAVKVDFTYTNQSQYLATGSVVGPIYPQFPTADLTAAAGETTYANKQYATDFTLNGGFRLFGHDQVFVVGGSYSYETGPSNVYNALTFAPQSSTLANTSPSVNIYDFNPNAPQYARAGDPSLAFNFPRNDQEQYTLYSNTKITFIDPLHLILGFRFSGYSYQNTTQFFCGGFLYEFGLCSTQGAVTSSIPAKYSDSHGSWPPDASLVYDVTKDISAYVSYTDIYISNAGTIRLNGSPVAPTTGYNEEIGVKWQRPDKKLNASFAIFNIDQINFPWFDGFGPYASTYGNAGGGKACCYNTDGGSKVSRGVDAELAGEITKGWNFSSSYTFDYTENKGIHISNTGGPTYSQQPRNLFKLFTTYKFQSDDWLKRVSVGGGLNYQSATTYSGYQFFNEQKAYGLVSLRASYQIDKIWNVSLNANNVTDVKYFQTLGASGGGQFYGQPAAYTLNLRASW